MWIIIACGGGPGTEPPIAPSETSLPAETGSVGPIPTPAPITDLAGYLAACEAELGPWPTFSCPDGVEVPITVTDAAGTRTITSSADLEAGARCDRPAISGCWSGNRAGRAVGTTGTSWVYTCRNYSDEALFNQMNVIGWDPVGGAACFFTTHSQQDPHRFDGSRVPRPGSSEDLDFFGDGTPFWMPFSTMAVAPCRTCHDTDPWLRDPWIVQTGVLPEVPLFSPVRVVAEAELIAGSPDWAPPPTLKDPDAAACLTCHDLTRGLSCTLARQAIGDADGTTLVSLHYRNTWPVDRWMDDFDPATLISRYPTEADWDASFGLAADAVRRCCVADPPAGCF